MDLRTWLLPKLFILILLTIAAYYPASEAGFIIDDKEFFLEDSVVTASDGLYRIWFHPTDNNRVWPYLPITRMTFWLENQLWGLAPQIAHWINILLHLLAAVLLWHALEHFHLPGAWWIGTLFAIHPVYVQSVAWVAERKNVVAAVFYILCLWSYLHFAKNNNWKWYGTALLLFLCALLSKTSVVMLPVILVILRLLFRLRFTVKDCWMLLPFFLLSLVMGYVRVWFELHAFDAITSTGTFLEKILTAIHVPFFYFTKLLFPYPLIFTYPKWEIDSSLASVYVPIVSLLLILLVLVWKYQSWGRYLFCGLAACLVTLFPVSGFFTNAWTQFSYVADHWFHLPSIPILILFAQGAYWGIEKFHFFDQIRRYLWPFFAAAVVVILSILTWNQSLIYQDLKTLWLATIQQNERSWVAHQELGRIFREEKQHEQALKHSNQAIQLKKNPFRAYNNKGNVYADLKQYNQAIQNYNEALKIYPGFVDAYYNRGIAYFHLTQYQRALEDYSHALRIDPSYVKAYYNRGHVYFHSRKYKQAIEDFSHVLTINRDDVDARYNRGNAYALLQENQSALDDYNEVLQLNPNFSKAYNSRGLLYLTKMQSPQKGCLDLQQACQLGLCEYYDFFKKRKYCL
ncbi:MAG: tetratricopeptide repeat protein [SAR324 cluster bacterium]|nr:tetratricopeptide repeat protein [SAR324 cluster bacterium]